MSRLGRHTARASLYAVTALLSAYFTRDMSCNYLTIPETSIFAARQWWHLRISSPHHSSIGTERERRLQWVNFSECVQKVQNTASQVPKPHILCLHKLESMITGSHKHIQMPSKHLQAESKTRTYTLFATCISSVDLLKCDQVWVQYMILTLSQPINVQSFDLTSPEPADLALPGGAWCVIFCTKLSEQLVPEIRKLVVHPNHTLCPVIIQV